MKSKCNSRGIRSRSIRSIEPLESRLFLAAIRYVDMNAPGPTHDGTSWDSAYVDLQQALGIASSGDEIRVADGTYKPTSTTNRSISFQLKSGVSILGGYAGSGAEDPDARNIAGNVTVLSGDIGVIGNVADNSNHILDGSATDSTAVLDGFTVTAGNPEGSFGDLWIFGGGMRNVSGAPSIRNCTFSGNLRGGMYNFSSSPTIDNCTFSTNSEGAIYNEGSSPTVTNSSFAGNSGGRGGAMLNSSGSTPIIRYCTFTGNSGTGSPGGGGAVYNYGSSPDIRNCTFDGNTAGSNNGGAVYNNDSSSPVISDCVFSNNSAKGGGAVYNSGSGTKFTNCIFRGNTAESGGAVSNASVASPTFFAGCTFDANTATNGGGGGISNGGGMTLLDCRFIRNSAPVTFSGGGGIYNIGPRASPTLSGCTFDGNTAGAYGGAMYSYYSASPKLTNCTFVGNTAMIGGVLFTYKDSSLSVANCVFVKGAATFSTSAVIAATSSTTLTISNSIVWGNSSPSGEQVVNDATGTTTISYSNIQGDWAGPGNIDADPEFVRNPGPGPDNTWGTEDDDYGDLRLQATSPCIDAGSNTAVPDGITTDLVGNARFVDVPGVKDPGVIVDMGVYEYAVPVIGVGGAFLFDAPQPSVKIAFNANLSASSLSAADLTLLNVTLGQTIDCGAAATVSYDLAGGSATWAFGAILLPDGNYRATLPAGSVSDAGGSPLATDFSFDFFVLLGDANRDRKVDVGDLGILASNWQLSPRTFSQADFNYDGVVNVADLGILATNWQKSLATPAVPASSAAPLFSAARALVPLCSTLLTTASKHRSLLEDVGLIAV